jgi:hypothetical protein
MININIGTTNSITLRLNDNTTINNPIFLFELTSIQSNNRFYFTAQDLSTTKRFNTFQIYESGTNSVPVSLTASIPTIKLDYGGSYLYKVYQTDNYNLIPTNRILDTGIAIFKSGNEYETKDTFDFEDDAIWSIFDPEFEVISISYILTEQGDFLLTEQGDNLVF